MYTLPENIIIRALEVSDYDKGFLQVLEQLTTVGDISREEFENRFNLMVNGGSRVFVAIDTISEQVIGTAAGVCDRKFIHGCGSVIHIEEVVVDREYRRKGIGACLVQRLQEYARELKCYKVVLNASEQVVGFYEKCGLGSKGYLMNIYFDYN
ncbi:hypothetical protein PCE1_004992 [Barthelona sp. PCE]